MVRRRKTTTFGEISEEFIARVDPLGKRHESRAVALWSQVAGEEIVKHTRGMAIREGELVVYVDSPGWASELTMMSEHLRARINSAAGEDLVKSIRFNVSRRVDLDRKQEVIVEAEQRFYAIDETPSVALSEEELDQARYVADVIDDPELRERALRVMIKDLERKKGVRAAKRAHGGTGGFSDGGSGS